MKKLILLISCLTAFKSFSQNKFMVISDTAANGEFYNIVQSADGNYVATGLTFKKDAEGDTYIVKLNTGGQQIWSKLISTGNSDEGFGITNTSDGGFAVSGSTGDEMGISKFDASGNLSWSKQYNELTTSDASRMIQTSDGGYLLPGGISSDDFNTAQSYLIKTDASGNVQWSKKYFNTPYSIIYEVRKTSDNNYVFLALNYDDTNDDGSDSAYIVKVNSTGNVIWAKYFFSPDEYVDGYALTTTSDGGYLITGEAYFDSDNGFMLKLDGNGNYKWSKSTNVSSSFGGAIFLDAIETADGGYVAVGNVGKVDFADSTYFYLVKVNSVGTLLWTKEIKYGDGYNILYKLIKTSEGSYISVGSNADKTTEVHHALVAKFDGDFNTCMPSVSFGSLIDFGSLETGNVPTFTGNTIVSGITPAVTSIGSFVNICSVLPLDLLSFDASLQNKSVQLQWKTAEEKNTSYFDIEKSSDAKVFTSFARVTAAGNSNMVKSYTTSDNNPFKGDNWYRLKMVDKDGVFTYSNQVKVNNNGNGSAYLYPNPALSHAELRFNANNAGNYILKITDMSGKVLQTLTGKFMSGDNMIHLNTGNLAQGLYLVSLIADGQPKVVLKLNKQ